jgi:adenylate cyclase
VSDRSNHGVEVLRRLLGRSERSPVPAGFRDALTREILLTERLRIKAVLVTVSLLVAVLSAIYLFAPSGLLHITHGRFELVRLYAVYIPFLLFELTVLRLLARRLAMHRDVPTLRRYLSALIETSLPTFALYLEMNWMGPAQALAFAAPLAYFIFIILSTLRLDFWLSTFTGLVAAAELLVMAMWYHPADFAGEPASEFGFHLVRSVILLVGGILAGTVGCSCGISSRPALRLRPRAIASPICLVSTFRLKWSSGYWPKALVPRAISGGSP